MTSIKGVLFLRNIDGEMKWFNGDSGNEVKYEGGKWVVFYIAIAQLFSMANGINGTIIMNSKYYKYDLYTNVVLVFVTIITNYLLIPESSPLSSYGIVGINGAAFATAISVLLFNLIRLILIKVKMNMHPFSLQTIKTILLLFAMFFTLDFLPNSSYAFVDIIWKSIVVVILFIPAVIYFNLSEDITAIVKELKAKLLF